MSTRMIDADPKRLGSGVAVAIAAALKRAGFRVEHDQDSGIIWVVARGRYTYRVSVERRVRR